MLKKYLILIILSVFVRINITAGQNNYRNVFSKTFLRNISSTWNTELEETLIDKLVKRLENKLTDILEFRLVQNYEKVLEGKIVSKLEEKLAKKAEGQLDKITESKLKHKLESVLEALVVKPGNILENKLAEELSSKLEKNLELKLDNIFETKLVEKLASGVYDASQYNKLKEELRVNLEEQIENKLKKCFYPCNAPGKVPQNNYTEINQSCSTERCPAQWTSSAWGRCSKRCGEGGVMARDVTCTQIISNGYASIVDDRKCLERIGKKPEQFQRCNENVTCPEWFTGPWKPCNKLCDQGKQKRQVVCYQKVGGRIEVFEDSECEGEKPAVEQPCMLTPCLGVDWMLSEWSGCESCFSKNSSRSAICVTTEEAVVNDSFCAHHEAPVTQKVCNKTTLPSCGVQPQVDGAAVFCGIDDGNSLQKVNDNKCAGQSKYNDTKDYEVPKDKCSYDWFMGRWSRCHGKIQYRNITCIHCGESRASDELCSENSMYLPYLVQNCDDGTEKRDDDAYDKVPDIEEYFTTRTCNKTTFGCCPNKITPALGPFDEGCIKYKACKETEYGCCPDGLSPASGPEFEGCPWEPCERTLFGCCRSDNKTAAEGNDQEGCPPPPPACLASEYGCCKDGETQPTGPGKEGCLETITTKTTGPISSPIPLPSETPMTTSETPVTSSTSEASETSTSILPTQAVQSCGVSEYGCCYDNTTAATGPDQQGCPCHATEFGCCTDGVTPAHGLDYEGCCLLHAFGCCPDNSKAADGPHFEGCGCQSSRFGCCPDNITVATGLDHKGCGCQYSEYGCCPDGHQKASGPEFTGCSCHTYQFGCCTDGVTAAPGPGSYGCYCQPTTFGCCGDELTHAKGPNKEGCDCATSKHGCCLDGITEATGPKFQGCADKPENRQAACKLEFCRGSGKNYTVKWFYDMEYGGCSRFWHAGCEGNGNRFDAKEDCKKTCVSPPSKDVCKLPQVKGACLGYDIRWYYDNEHDSCSTFVYGGCLGNDNNFESRELCQAQCEPERAKDECSLPLERGRCGGNYSRWGYNKAARRCEEFVWGGCEGNSNRFSSEAACQLRCNPPGKPQPECLEQQDIGNCTDTKAWWTFSQSENRCLPFYYTGCGGNGNKFRTREDCEEACPSAYVPGVCTLPALIGNCSDYTTRWYFDTLFQRCRLFYYSGCDGNENNFKTEHECQKDCPAAALTTNAMTDSD